MGRSALIRSVRCNFLKMCIANSEHHSRVCTSASQDRPLVAVRGENPGVAQYRTGVKDLGLGKEDLGLGSRVQAAGRGTLVPVAGLCHHLDSLERRYSSASGTRVDVGGIVQIELAQTGEGIADCELLQWFVQEGDEVDEFQPLCEVQSDKASVEITSRYQGKVTRVNFIPGDIVKVGETLLELIIDGKDTPTPHRTSQDSEHESNSLNLSTEPPEGREGREGIQATPAVRHLAKSNGVNLADIPGSGDGGRILKEDVLKFVTSKEELSEELRSINSDPGYGGGLQYESSDSESELDTPVSKGGDVFSKEGEVVVDSKHGGEDLLCGDKIIPVRGFRRIMVKTMTAAVAVPHFYYTEDVNVDALVQLKEDLKGVALDAGVKVTYLPFLIKAVSLALKDYPLMNSTVNEDMTEITMRASHNVGVGMATNSGLVVPNIKNVQNLSVLEIATELSRLTVLAATNKLSNEDVTGGTITVSNFGAIGGKYGSPILNLPEVAIVAFGRIQKLPCYAEDGSVYPASIMGVTWAADHRIIDGATVARFCNRWKLLIEQPGQFLLSLR